MSNAFGMACMTNKTDKTMLMRPFVCVLDGGWMAVFSLIFGAVRC